MNKTEFLKIDVHLQFNDFLRGSYWFLFRSWIMKILTAFAALTLVLGIVTTINSPANTPWGVFILPGILLIIVFNTYFASKRNFTSNQSLQEPIQYCFSTEGIDAIASTSSSSHTVWANIREFAETSNYFLVFISNNQFYVFPKRFFAGNNGVEEFRVLLKKNIGPAARKNDIKIDIRRFGTIFFFWILIALFAAIFFILNK